MAEESFCREDEAAETLKLEELKRQMAELSSEHASDDGARHSPPTDPSATGLQLSLHTSEPTVNQVASETSYASYVCIGIDPGSDRQKSAIERLSSPEFESEFEKLFRGLDK